MTRARAAEELGGYLCDGRYGRTGRALARDGSDCESAIRSLLLERQQAEHALHNQSTNKPDVSQRRAGGGMSNAILALDMPTRILTDCEWVEKGIKEILNVMAKGETPSKREHPEVWALVEERAKSLPARWLEVEHVPGHATEEMVMQE